MNVSFSRLLMRSLSISLVLFTAGEYSSATEPTTPDRNSTIPIDLPLPTQPQSDSTPSNPALNKTTQEVKPIVDAELDACKATDLIEPTLAKTPEIKPAVIVNPTPIQTPVVQPIASPTPIVTPAPDKPSDDPNKPMVDPKSTSQERGTGEETGVATARAIAVKIVASDFIGTGTIVGFEKGVYTIVSNAHVVNLGKAPYKIITTDRVLHQATLVPHTEFKKYDLAILQFRAPGKKYEVGKLGKSANLQTGDRLFVGGFTKQAKERDLDDFLVQTGSISLVLKSAMENTGYKIGYTHRIYRGMSGGPVVDETGNLVGINGMLGDPLWKNITKFADGSSACEPLQNLIDRSAFAIAIDDVAALTPDAKWWQKPTPTPAVKTNDPSIVNQEISNLKQAETRAVSCQ
jgi:S1-C subfamily serine protease